MMHLILDQPQPVLDHGYVKYIGHLGSDESIIEAARMSTGKGFFSWEPYITCGKCGLWGSMDAARTLGTKLEVKSGCAHGEYKESPRGDLGLLEYLYRNKHMTPFEMCELVVEVKAPIFVFRELHRHRTFSINEMSARYIQMPNQHYVPELERFVPKQTGNKQADSVVREPMGTPKALRLSVIGEQDDTYDFYELMLKNGVPKEVARVNTPVSRYSVMRWKGNLRNFLQMFALRDHAAAQWECQQTVKPIVQIAKSLFPRTMELFDEHTKYAVTFSRAEMAKLHTQLCTQDELAREDKKLLQDKVLAWVTTVNSK